VAGLCWLGFAAAPALAQPANDNFANATSIAGIAGSTSGTSASATKESGEPLHAGDAGGGSVWFYWTAPVNGHVTFTTAGSGFDTLLAVYTGSAVNSLTPIAADDDSGPGSTSSLTFSAVAGTIYRIAIDGFGGARGNYSLSWGSAGSAGVFGFTTTAYFASEREGSSPVFTSMDRSFNAARITITRSGGEVGKVDVRFRITDGTAPSPGSYTPPASATVVATTNATATAISTAGVITAITVNNAGFGYFYTAPVVTIIDPTGTNAMAVANILNGRITSINVVTGGTNYSANPTVSIAAPPNSYDDTVTFFHLQNSRSFFITPRLNANTNVPVIATVNLAILSATLASGESSQILAPSVRSTDVLPAGVAAAPSVLQIMDSTIGINFERVRFRTGEGIGTATIRVLRGAGVANDTTTRYQINGTGFGVTVAAPNNSIFPLDAGSDYATPGSDFTAVSGIITWASGVNLFDIAIPILDDNAVEFNEDFVVQLFNASGDSAPAPLGASVNAFITIVTEDRAAQEQPAGSVDPAWNRDYFDDTIPPRNPTPGANNIVQAVAVQSNSRTVLGGDFTAINTLSRNRIARLNTDGSVDTNFTIGTGFNATVNALLIQSNQQIVVGGNFSSYNGVLRGGIARLNSTGALDGGFNPGNGANGAVRAVAIHTNGPNLGKIVVVGDFTQFSGSGVGRIIRLNPDGSLDPQFTPDTGGANGPVYAVVIQPSGQMLIGGAFTAFGPYAANRIARLNADGTFDKNFNPGAGADDIVYAVALDPANSSRYLVGGAFGSMDLRGRNHIARLNADGSLDASFDPGVGADDTVFAITGTTNSAVFIGGLFTSFNSTRRVGIARLLADGTLDTGFLDPAYNQFAGIPTTFSPLVEPKNFVRSIAVQSDGDVIVGGSFKHVGGGGRNTAASGQASPWGSGVTTPSWIARDDIRNRFNIARLIGDSTPGPGNITFTQDNYSVDEYAGSVFITLSRTHGSLGAVGALIATGDRPAGPGAATVRSDYLDNTKTVVWPSTHGSVSNTRMFSDANSGANNNTQTGQDDFSITIFDDGLVEGNETLNLGLDLPASQMTLGGENIPLGVALGSSSATLTIVEDDVPPAIIGFGTNSFTVDEGAGVATINVTRSGNTQGTVSVDFFTLDGTNNPAIDTQDYFGQSGTLTFVPGQTNATFSIPIIDDTSAETDETIRLVLTNLTIGASFSSGGNAATLTIFDNDFASGTLRFSASSYSVNEAQGLLTVTVQRTGGNLGAVAVDFATVDGSAVSTGPNPDFAGVSGTLTWASGDTMPKTYTVPVALDGKVEGTETFTNRLFNARVLSSGSNVPIALGTNSVNLLDADAYGSLQFAASSYSVSENGGAAIITVSRAGGSSETVSVNFAATPGTASNSVDFVATNGTLVLGPGITSANFPVQILDNPAQNTNIAGSFNRTVLLVLSNQVPGTLGAPPTAVLNIIDDEHVNEPAGSVDTTYNASAGANGFLYALALQPDGRLLIGGDFTTFNGLPRHRLARLDANGQLDSVFDPGTGASDPVRGLALQADGRVIVGGPFTNLGGFARRGIGRLNVDGTVDETFDPGAGADNPVAAMAIHQDAANSGKIIVVGEFATFNGVNRPYVTRLNPDGMVDGSFATGLGPNGPVTATVIQSDGRVLIGGDFTEVNGVPSHRLARLNANGSLDTNFTASLGSGFDNSVRAIAIQSDGKILVGGLFTNYNGAAVNRLARLNTDGTSDARFLPNASSLLGGDNSVLGLALQPDGKIIVVGDFTVFSGVSRSRITRLRNDGSVDPTINFGSGANSFITTATVQLNDGKIIVGGGFTNFDGLARNYLARLHGGVIAGPGRFEFTSAAYASPENVTNVVITVRRRGGTTGAVGVTAATVDGTAVSGPPNPDYLATNALLNFAEGETFAVFSVLLVNDTLAEGNESLGLVLSNPTSGAALGNQPVSTLTIVDDDSVAAFSAASYSVNENVPSGVAQVTVVRSGGTNSTFSIDLVTTNGSATAGADYGGVSTTLTFLPGQLSKTVNIPIFDDALGEGDETFVVQLLNPVGPVSVGAPGAATVTIVENDLYAGTLNLTQSAFVVEENGGSFPVTVMRTNGASGPVTVSFATVSGSAVAGLDFVPISGTLFFSSGETVKSFSVQVLPDGVFDPLETFNIVLSNPTGGATIGVSNASVLINDNDPADSAFRISRQNTNAITITDVGPAVPYPSTITVSNITEVIKRVEVTLDNVAHPSPADLDVLLVGPQGQQVLLMSDAGANLALSGAFIRFAGDSTNALPDAAQITNGTYHPTDYPPAEVFPAPAPAGPYDTNFAVFNATSPNGTWSLYVVDDQSGGSGAIAGGWRLTIFTVDPASVADLSLSMSDAPDPVLVGSNVTYTITVSNNGPNAAANVVLTNPLPAMANFVTATPSQGTTTNLGAAVVANFGTIPSGGSATLALILQATSDGTITNFASANTSTQEIQFNNNSVAAVTTVNPSPNVADLRLAIHDSPDPVLVGDSLTYTVTLTNRGLATATNVRMTNTLPPNVTLLAQSASQGTATVNGGEIVFSLGTVPNGSGATATVVVRPDKAGVITNLVAAAADQPDFSPAIAAAETLVLPVSDLLLSIGDSADPAPLGGVLTYTILVFNSGPSAASSVTVVDTLPEAASFVSAIASQGTCTNFNGTLVCQLGGIANGSSAVISVQVVPLAGTITNTATVFAAEVDPVLANNTDVETTATFIQTTGLTITPSTNAADLANAVLAPGSSGLRITSVNLLAHQNGGATSSGLYAVGAPPVPYGINAPGIIISTGDVSDYGAGPNTSTGNTTAFGVAATPAQEALLDPITGVGTNNFQHFDVTQLDIRFDVEPGFNRVNFNVVFGSEEYPEFVNSLFIDGFGIYLNGTNIAFTGGAPVNINHPAMAPLAGTELDGILAPGGNPILSFTAPVTAGSSNNILTFIVADTSDTILDTTVFVSSLQGGGVNADLAVNVTDTPDPAVVGSPLIYNIVVNNFGPNTATNTVLTNTLPASMTLVGATPSQGSCSFSNNVLVCNLGDLVSGGGAIVTLTVTPTLAGQFTNLVAVSSDLRDLASGNNTNSAVTTVIEPFTFINNSPIQVADASPALPYPSIITVSNLTGAIGKVTVSLAGLQHTFPADLDILLVAPDGRAAVVMSDAGGGNDITNVNLTLDDAAAAFLPQSGQIVSGTFKPTDYEPGMDSFTNPAPAGPYASSLAVFNGGDPNGDWKLFVVDDQGSDVGALLGGWRLTFQLGGPALQIERSGDNVIVSWSAALTGYVLESRTSVNVGAWTPVGVQVVVSGGKNTVTLSAGPGAQFFRLRKP
jgi:uncharacterized repeat protein (TIGR01451 family)/uncharacterized delta-60 repeat protein